MGSIFVQNHPIYIYVLKGDVQDLMMYLKWRDFGGRMIIITESLNHLSTLKLSEGLKVRVALEEELRNSCRGELFYSRISEGN
ncbi:hypothetical protein ABER98_19395 [Domibacillus aminovorans]|uniref:hypothetical protein n=1 Tax=Domibacillus aminovorans TaxID=29332 RepID=UPI003D25B74C